ncbi:helicase HerA-like domain-containing protein [Pseudomonas sp. FME51]|uniref:helicase HerA-like domain-containing protein n=1 Tax=Pseudomonas sp. FME51 TaxID=2742609 RepID=UPI0018673410|nr:helicase HerA-like domain-containing protein [Pseudomonas sp. FME51]
MESYLQLGGAQGRLIAQPLKMCNRHGLIAGATGTGKTVTLQVLAETFAHAGIPVFAADIKGDLSGVAVAAVPSEPVDQRLAKMPGLEWQPGSAPVVFWDILDNAGHPLRTTISEMGPLLLASLLDLNDNQLSALYGIFAWADQQGMLLLDLKDLQALMDWLLKHPQELSSLSGGISTASIQAIQRRLLILEQQGAERLFGGPALQLADLMQRDISGRAHIHLLEASRLIQESPRVYASFLLWLLSELHEQLPEQGDADKPRLVLFFDEAHLLFKGTPKALHERIEQVVRLIRSKGVGVFFVTQSPSDLPDAVLAQLGLRIQHALRAYTPKEQKALRAVAEGFRSNPEFDTREVLTELGVGEALVSVLDEKGRPSVVERTLIAPPRSRIGVLSEGERDAVFRSSPLAGRYERGIDRESAYELLATRAQQTQVEEEEQKTQKTPKSAAKKTEKGMLDGLINSTVRSTLQTLARQIGRELARGLLGSLTGRK